MRIHMKAYNPIDQNSTRNRKINLASVVKIFLADGKTKMKSNPLIDWVKAGRAIIFMEYWL